MANSNLIPVFSGSIQNQSVQLCNASKLHAFLDVQSKFADWIKNRIDDYGFIQNEDYIIVTERTAGRPRKEYHITLDMGKELAMVERNEKGRAIRKYFIECEKQAKQQTLPEKKVNIKTVTYKPNPISVDERELISIIMLFHKLKPIARDLQIISSELKHRNQFSLGDIASDHAYTLTKSSLISRVESTVHRFICSCQREADQKMFFEMLYSD